MESSDKTSKKMIEIQGVKFEVDLRTAIKVTSLKVGDTVKVLKKETYGDTFKTYPGVIVGFDNFDRLPTVIVAITKISYTEASLEMIYFNESNKEDVELIKVEDDIISIEKSKVITMFNKKIEEAQASIDEYEQKKAYFLKFFGKFFKDDKRISSDPANVIE